MHQTFPFTIRPRDGDRALVGQVGPTIDPEKVATVGIASGSAAMGGHHEIGFAPPFNTTQRGEIVGRNWMQGVCQSISKVQGHGRICALDRVVPKFCSELVHHRGAQLLDQRMLQCGTFEFKQDIGIAAIADTDFWIGLRC